MAKYRLLSSDELIVLQKEFIDYLVVNGITAEDWERIKINDIYNAERIIELFSDVVFEGVFRKVKFLDFKSQNTLKSFQCLDDKIVLVALDVEDEDVNLLDVKDFNAILNNLPLNVKVYTSEKKYTQTRERELFTMVASGCEISDGSLFKSLCLALA